MFGKAEVVRVTCGRSVAENSEDGVVERDSVEPSSDADEDEGELGGCSSGVTYRPEGK